MSDLEDVARATLDLAMAVSRERVRVALAAAVPAIRAAALEEAASVAGAVQTKLAANAKSCACGNGRVPVTAHRQACQAFAGAIRALAAGGATDGQMPAPHPLPQGEG